MDKLLGIGYQHRPVFAVICDILTQSIHAVVFLEEEPIEIVLRSLLCASYKLEMSIQSLVSYNYS